MRGLLNFIIVVFAVLSANVAISATHYAEVQWRQPVGSVAAYCFSTLPDERPMAVPRTLVVDNNLPDGSEVYSWGYGTFSDVVLGCTSTGNPSGSGTAATLVPQNEFRVGSINDSFRGMALSDSGLRLKVWISPITSSSPCTGSGCSSYGNIYDLSATSLYPSLAAGNEVELTTNWGVTLAQRINAYGSGSALFYPTTSGRYAIRATIIKVGNLQYNGPLKAPGSLYIRSLNYVDERIFDGAAIQIIPPACRLSSPNSYNIDMNRWVNHDAVNTSVPNTLPAYGSIKPVDLNLECSGQVNGVQFRFEDAGSSPSSNKNISLYDSAGGNKIEGLEIEMRYGGSRVAVDNITKTDTGSKGAIKTNPQDLSFNSQDSATFGARFVQTAPIKKSGAIYTGPVTGKVNMYVTYH